MEYDIWNNRNSMIFSGAAFDWRANMIKPEVATSLCEINWCYRKSGPTHHEWVSWDLVRGPRSSGSSGPWGSIYPETTVKKKVKLSVIVEHVIEAGKFIVMIENKLSSNHLSDLGVQWVSKWSLILTFLLM